MKKANLFYLSAILFYLVAALNFANSQDHSTAVVWFCLGSSLLCLGSTQHKK